MDKGSSKLPICKDLTLSPEAGVSLSVSLWEPFGVEDEIASKSPQTLLVIHGACEHRGKYDQFAQYAARSGWRVIVPDLRGHGTSTGEFVHVFEFEEYLKDLDFLVNSFECTAENTVILGSSMGGLIAIRYVQTRPNPCSSAVLLSPFLGLKLVVPKWKKIAGEWLSRYLPRTRFRSTINPKDLTHDPNALEKRRKDTLIRRAVSARWFIETAQSIEQAFTNAEKYSVPTFVFQSGEDRIVDSLATKAWTESVNRLNSLPLVKLQVLQGWYHEMLKEEHWEQVADQILCYAESSFSESTLIS